MAWSSLQQLPHLTIFVAMRLLHRRSGRRLPIGYVLKMIYASVADFLVSATKQGLLERKCDFMDVSLSANRVAFAGVAIGQFIGPEF
jgi:hypothetical protein